MCAIMVGGEYLRVAHIKSQTTFSSPSNQKMEGTGLTKVKRTLAIMLALLVFLTGCTREAAPSTKSADNATPGIETVMYEIKDQGTETLAAFDTDGRLIFDTTSNASGYVSMTGEQLEMFRAQDGALTLHNHPSGSTFSVEDLRAEAQRGTRRAMVVTNKDLYILEPGWRGWGDPDKLCQAYEAYVEQYSVEAQANTNLNTRRATIIWVQHQALTAVAADFGLSYTTIPVDEVFCFHGIYVVTAG